ncbi:hypothetical protein [Kineococcus arenarius]|uniref:hypothetical protein n=1 Tax=unclassified Kineococcus TaxID=2621656 RepID=UPI003D7EC95F
MGVNPSVCAPESRATLVEPIQNSLSRAYEVLDGTPFTKPAAFRVTRLDHYSDLDGAAPLDFDPEYIRGDQYNVGAIAAALTRPHQCRELFSAAEAVPLLQAQEVVQPWIVAALTGQVPAQPVPEEVLAEFRLIQHCDVMTGDLH